VSPGVTLIARCSGGVPGEAGMLYLYGLLGVAFTAAAVWLVTRYGLRRRYLYLALVPALICFTLLFRVLLDWQFSTLGLLGACLFGLLYAILRVEGSSQR